MWGVVVTEYSEETVALAGLVRVCEPPSASLALFVDKVGPVAAWRGVLDRRAPRPVLSATAARTQNLTQEVLIDRARADLRIATAAGARLIGRDHPDWPVQAVQSFEGALARGVRGAGPPVALYLRGRSLVTLPEHAVTVVGSRASSAYGQRVASELAHELSVRGLTIISGAAFGIDTAAHRSALVAARSRPPSVSPSTVAVLACGIDRAYPEANRVLLEAISQSGSVVSEYPPGTVPARHRFLVRNRLIAALGAATVVVEAGRRSGTLSTAAAAEQLGRMVMAVPGPVTSAMSVGCHLLLADRFAQLVTGADDVLAALGRNPPGAVLAPADPAPGADPDHPTDGLDLDSSRVYDSLPARGFSSVDELITESGLLASQVMGALAILQLHGLATAKGPSWRRVVAAERR